MRSLKCGGFTRFCSRPGLVRVVRFEEKLLLRQERRIAGRATGARALHERVATMRRAVVRHQPAPAAVTVTVVVRIERKQEVVLAGIEAHVPGGGFHAVVPEAEPQSNVVVVQRRRVHHPKGRRVRRNGVVQRWRDLNASTFAASAGHVQISAAAGLVQQVLVVIFKVLHQTGSHAAVGGSRATVAVTVNTSIVRAVMFSLLINFWLRRFCVVQPQAAGNGQNEACEEASEIAQFSNEIGFYAANQSPAFPFSIQVRYSRKSQQRVNRGS